MVSQPADETSARSVPAYPSFRRPQPVYRAVIEFIKDYILSNGLKHGDTLPSEVELSRQLGVSRTSVREAVKALGSLGVVETRPGAGLCVGSFTFGSLVEMLPYGLLQDLTDLRDLLEVRHVLEVGMIASAIEVMAEETLASLRSTLEQMQRKAERGERMFDEDRRFHQLLYQDTGNRTLLKVLDAFWLACHKASQYAKLPQADPKVTFQVHLDIVRAIEAKDVAAAKASLERHYDGIYQSLRELAAKADG